MLKKITLDNFTTFITKKEISFEATNSKILESTNIGANKILKGALFVGENASGKTNILQAIKLLSDLLASNTFVNFATYKSFYSDRDTFTLSYYFDIKKIEIVYNLEFDDNGIVSEEVIKDGFTVLKRTKNSAKFTFDSNVPYTKAHEIPNTLPFLRKLFFDTHFNNDKILNKWYTFITNAIYVNCNTRKIIASEAIYDELLLSNYFDNGGIDEVNDFLKSIGYNHDVIYADISKFFFNPKRTDFASNKVVAFRKRGTKLYIPEVFESAGNNTLINVLPAILCAIKHSGMIIIDEFSSGMHNELEEALIKFFFIRAKKDTQLFFTSHSTNLLDNSILRPDQIYSVRFNYKEGGSILSRFSDQSPREAQNTEKMYLSGVFDEVPRYTEHLTD